MDENVVTKTVIQGETFATADSNVECTTVLGSCVSICLFDPSSGAGGMNHYLLSGENGTNAVDQRYGIFAFEKLLNEILKLGADRFSVKAKVFGGASIDGRFSSLGPENAEFARKVLADEGIECVGSDVGGTLARKLRFRPCTGDAMMMLVPGVQVKEEPAKPTGSQESESIELF